MGVRPRAADAGTTRTERTAAEAAGTEGVGTGRVTAVGGGTGHVTTEGADTGRAGSRARRARDRAILLAGRTLVARGLVVGTVGNVSARSGDRLRITPTRVAYATMRRRDLVTVDVASGRPATGATPSRELPLHLAVYRARPDVAAVIHTHSVAATAWSFLDTPLEPELEDLAYHGIGPIRTAAPAPAGSDALARNVSAALGTSNAVLLGAHGVLAVGPTVADALTIAEVVEHQARVAWTLRGA